MPTLKLQGLLTGVAMCSVIPERNRSLWVPGVCTLAAQARCSRGAAVRWQAVFFHWSPSFFTICSAACRSAPLLSLCWTGSNYTEHLGTSTNYHRNTPPSTSIVSHPSWRLLGLEECWDLITTLAPAMASHRSDSRRPLAVWASCQAAAEGCVCDCVNAHR